MITDSANCWASGQWVGGLVAGGSVVCESDNTQEKTGVR